MKQKHTIDIDEREHRQEEEEFIEIADQNEMNSDEPPCIFRVHEQLRHVNEKAYTPALVSIGPYHHGDPKLLPMEKYKERFWELLLQRSNPSGRNYWHSMQQLEGRAREYYTSTSDLDSEKFVKMMIYDACFVISFIGIMHQKFLGIRGLVVDDDPIFNVESTRMQIYRDLMLLENQLPLFVISEFFDMSSSGHTQSIIEMATMLIIEQLPGKIYNFENTSGSKSKHFLDLVHNICLPSRGQNKTQRNCFKMPRVIELEDAGVKFEVEMESPNMFDIRFEHGHFKIPKFRVTDSTETFFRNIIAYEQYSSDDEPKYFTDYIYLMDLLINSTEDVNKLRRHEIIDNMMFGDEEVAIMFNRLVQGTIISPRFYYSDLCSKVNDHWEKWRMRGGETVATLKRDYFKNIWVTIATIAAAFLLLLTLTQTVIALITILSPSPTRC